MISQTAKKLAPVFGNDQKIDVAVEDGRAVIKLSTWVEGLGWSCQKTMDLDGGLVEDLHRSLAAARCRISETDDSRETDCKVINFPSV